MLSDEEKKAIKYFYNLRATIDESNMLFDEDINVKCGNETIKQITLVLNLIEKQQKEIEELKNITKSYDSFLGDEKIVIADKKFFVNGYFQENFVRKDKIKAEIEELKEDNKKKSIVIIEYQDLYEKLVDKIKAEIEELKKNMKVDGEVFTTAVNFGIKVLQSLLEKE